jgi:hypothetical protein
MAKIIEIQVDHRRLNKRVKLARNKLGQFRKTTSNKLTQIARQGAINLAYATPVATGGLVGSTTIATSRTHGVWRLRISQPARTQITGLPLSTYAGLGRGSGRPPPVSAIMAWMTVKGMVPVNSPGKGRGRATMKRSAYLIARAIGRNGTLTYQRKPPPYWEAPLRAIKNDMRKLLGQLTTDLKIYFEREGKNVTGGSDDIGDDGIDFDEGEF